MRTMQCLLLLAVLSAPAAASADIRCEGACGPKIEAFEFLIDHSGSMMLTDKASGMQKIALAKQVVKRINAALPDMEWRAGMHTLAPAREIVPVSVWNRKDMALSVDVISSERDIFGRMTNMGDGLSMGIAKRLGPLGNNAAVILLTAGDNNRGMEVTQAVAELRNVNPSMRVHIVSFADNKKGVETVRRLHALDTRGMLEDGYSLATDDRALNDFLRAVFVDDIAPNITASAVRFDFAKAALTDGSKHQLDRLAVMIRDHCPARHVLIDGFADEIGTQARNIPLSQRRANNVRDYLVARGVPAKRLIATGFGESKTFGSDERGRAMNRRVILRWE